MKIHFYIKYKTHFGQALFITGNHPALGENKESRAVELAYFNENYWHLSLEIENNFKGPLHYRYFLKEKDGTLITDGDEKRTISLHKSRKETVVVDTWVSRGFEGNVFYAEAFQNVLLPHAKNDKHRDPGTYSHEFNIKAPLLKQHETVCLIGSVPGLGSWEKEKAFPLYKNQEYYTGRVLLTETDWPASYKYGIYDLQKGTFVRYEEGGNRMLFEQPKEGTAMVIHDGFIHEPMNSWKAAGVAIPVFSLRSKSGFGTGEFLDIKLMVDWAKKTNLQLIQLLPVNDTIANFDWGDSYPYAAISAFALHPLYINLDKVAGKHKAILKGLRKKQKELNALPTVNYPQVISHKLEVLKQLYELQKPALETDGNFRQFVSQNEDWLLPYAAFCTLRDQYKTPDFSKWKRHSTYDKKAIDRMAKKGNTNYDSLTFYLFIQYHLHLQLQEAVQYARKNKVAIKGDIPIGIYRYSCDAWVNPSLYNMHEQAGAPPDDFAVTGQNWGFPTYNWEKMKEEDFLWWKRRFEQMSMYFDGFRIDHILGFFRIWSIPISQTQGIMGRFVPAIPVDISEFHYHNIPFDYDRFCLPYITNEIIDHIFGEKANVVKRDFLEPFGDGRYCLKQEINTQAKAQEYLRNKADEEFKEGILELIANVILFEEEGSDRKKFHFRFNIASTSSFAGLNDDIKSKLHTLYINYFYERQNDFWKHEGLKKLIPLKNSTNMIVFGEDLGMVPDCVPEVMKQLAILSLEVERMPKNGSNEFSQTGKAPYLSVVTPSTHDMSTIREWWQENREKTQRFYNYLLHHYGEAPLQCEPWICREIIEEHLKSPAMWSIFQLQDILSISENLRQQDFNAERINDPANPHNHWNYRMHISLENLKQEEEFNNTLGNMISRGERLPLHMKNQNDNQLTNEITI